MRAQAARGAVDDETHTPTLRHTHSNARWRTRSQVFQDTDPRWRGANSADFMDYATEVMKGHGYTLGNVDVTLILERPKVAAIKPAMKENIVRLLDTTPGRVNVKARTHEKMDSVGQLRSIECHVVLTLLKQD